MELDINYFWIYSRRSYTECCYRTEIVLRIITRYMYYNSMYIDRFNQSLYLNNS